MPDTPAQVVLVLGAKLRPDGTPSPALERRARFAARLAIAEGATLICTGGATLICTVGATRTEADAMAEIATAEGVPQDRIAREDQAQNTWQNIALSKPLMPPQAKLIIVTDPSHGLRARMVARRQGLRPRMALTWGARPRARPMTALTLWAREFAALLVYWWRHRSAE